MDRALWNDCFFVSDIDIKKWIRARTRLQKTLLRWNFGIDNSKEFDCTFLLKSADFHFQDCPISQAEALTVKKLCNS